MKRLICLVTGFLRRERVALADDFVGGDDVPADAEVLARADGLRLQRLAGLTP